MQLLAKFRKILYMVFRATLNFRKLDILYEIYFSHQSAKSNFSYFTDCTKNTHRRAFLFIDTRQFIGFLHTKKLSGIYRHKPIVTYWALMKRHALLTIWAKLKLAIQLFFSRKVRPWRNPRKRVARGEKL